MMVGAFLILSALVATTSHGFEYEDLSSLIQTKSIRTIESLLPVLPTDFRSHYTLIHTSRSLQGASRTNPRVVLYGSDGRLSCSFNGDATQLRGDTFECIQFRTSTRKFDFRQIQFPKRGSSDPVMFSESGKSSDGKVSCLGCHGGSDPRPNWGEYPKWPGTYGSFHDRMQEDDKDFQEWLKAKPAHPRYRYLEQNDEEPNLHYGMLVTRYLALRNARILEEKVPLYKRLGFAVKALNCRLNATQLASVRTTPKYAEINIDWSTLLSTNGISNSLWTTQIFSDPMDSPLYQVHTGFGYLSHIVATAIAQNLSRAGNTALQSGLLSMEQSLTLARTGRPDTSYFTMVNHVVPDPEYFSKEFGRRNQLICPELSRLLVDELLHD
ncbi:MAG: hypothetical protein JST80_10565 [Bdellovibrionales bacterium]|nr:hypothetical protein [Bdellovibrionales bacterium]